MSLKKMALCADSTRNASDYTASVDESEGDHGSTCAESTVPMSRPIHGADNSQQGDTQSGVQPSSTSGPDFVTLHASAHEVDGGRCGAMPRFVGRPDIVSPHWMDVSVCDKMSSLSVNQSQSRDHNVPVAGNTEDRPCPVVQPALWQGINKEITVCTRCALPTGTGAYVDPEMKFLMHDIGDEIGTLMVENIKSLCRSSNSDYLCIPSSELETIDDGRQLVTAIRQRYPDYDESLAVLAEIFEAEDQKKLENMIKKERERVMACPRISPKRATPRRSSNPSPDGDSPTTSLVVLDKFPDGPRISSEVLTNPKTVYLMKTGNVVLTHRRGSKDPLLILLIPQAIWQKVLELESAIERAISRYKEGENRNRMLHVSGHTYIDISTFKGKACVHLKNYYRLGNALEPTKDGTTVILATWKKFMKFLSRANKTVTVSHA